MLSHPEILFLPFKTLTSHVVFEFRLIYNGAKGQATFQGRRFGAGAWPRAPRQLPPPRPHLPRSRGCRWTGSSRVRAPSEAQARGSRWTVGSPGLRAKGVEDTMEGMLLRLKGFGSLTDVLRSDAQPLLQA